MELKVNKPLVCKTSLRIFEKSDVDDTYRGIYFDAGKEYKIHHMIMKSSSIHGNEEVFSPNMCMVLDNNDEWCTFLVEDKSNPDNLNLKTLSLWNYFYTEKELRKAKLDEIQTR
jgi:hypothetical protein